jgi:hypothetical protein
LFSTVSILLNPSEFVMFSSRKFPVILLTAGMCFATINTASAQIPPAAYRLVPKTIYEKRPVTQSRWLEETVLEKQRVTSYKPVWNTEKRERRTTVLKPIQKTSYREERTTVRKPITETKYREKRVEETSYETVTEMRDEEYVVRKPVVETQMREENVTVRRKVTENLVEVQEVTTMRPVVTTETQMVPTTVPVTQSALVTDTWQRPRLQWLRPGYYVDPATGLSTYRRPGFHWVQPTVAAQVTALTPALVPQQVNQTTYMAEKTERRRPIEISRYVDQVETRKVPVEVTRYVEETRTRRVPVTVRKPVTKVRIEKVPYTETRYIEQVVVNRVPVIETEYQEVTQVEPYEVEVASWKTITEEIEVPRVVRRRVDYETTETVARTIMMKVPIDACGVEIGPPTPLYEQSSSRTIQPMISSGTSTTTSRLEPMTIVEPDRKELRESSQRVPNEPRYSGSWDPMEPKKLDETSAKQSILVPETTPQPGEMDKIKRPGGEEAEQSFQDVSAISDLEVSNDTRYAVPKVEMPENQPAESGNEEAADGKASVPEVELNGAQ